MEVKVRARTIEEKWEEERKEGEDLIRAMLGDMYVGFLKPLEAYAEKYLREENIPERIDLGTDRGELLAYRVVRSAEHAWKTAGWLEDRIKAYVYDIVKECLVPMLAIASREFIAGNRRYTFKIDWETLSNVIFDLAQLLHTARRLFRDLCQLEEEAYKEYKYLVEHAGKHEWQEAER